MMERMLPQTGDDPLSSTVFMLRGKKLLLGISGSIAAYKAAFLTRLLVKAGAEVKVIMTSDAQNFITPLTLHTLSRNQVYTEVATREAWNNHVELGLWADALVIAPATANTIAKLATGLCDNMLSAVYLSCRAPVFVAPAMDLDMWAHGATQRNIERLKKDDVRMIEVGEGELASGLVGPGRMAEPEEICGVLNEFFKKKGSLEGLKAMVTAGPTYEDLDPVRFIGNRSTGKMGLALAKALGDRGCEVHLVIGPNHLDLSHPLLEIHRVRSASQMAEVCVKIWPTVQLAILAAAVADFTPIETSSEKIKKSGRHELALQLTTTVDIAQEIGSTKQKDQISVGFALESQNGLENAEKKLREKNFDLLVLNSLQDEGSGFQYDTNQVTLLQPNLPHKRLPLQLKTELAEQIVDQVELLVSQKG